MANVKISDLTAAAAATSTQQFEVNDSGASKSVTGAQIAAFVEAEVSSGPSFTGDVTIADKIVHFGDTNTAIRFPAADTVTVETSGAERLRVDSSGNVGIGTSSPAQLLEVAGNIQSTVNGTSSILALSGDNTNYSALRLRQSSTVSRIENLIAGTGAYTPIAINTGGSERMRIDSSGNVGIGTSSPSTPLHVVGASTLSSVAVNDAVTTTADNDGTFSSGTYTPTPVGGNMKRIVNGGAFTLAAPTVAGDYTLVIQITNTTGAGAITLSGFNRSVGSAFTTTNGDDFMVFITKCNGFLLANTVALQ